MYIVQGNLYDVCTGRLYIYIYIYAYVVDYIEASTRYDVLQYGVHTAIVRILHIAMYSYYVLVLYMYVPMYVYVGTIMYIVHTLYLVPCTVYLVALYTLCVQVCSLV